MYKLFKPFPVIGALWLLSCYTHIYNQNFCRKNLPGTNRNGMKKRKPRKPRRPQTLLELTVWMRVFQTPGAQPKAVHQRRAVCFRYFASDFELLMGPRLFLDRHALYLHGCTWFQSVQFPWKYCICLVAVSSSPVEMLCWLCQLIYV